MQSSDSRGGSRAVRAAGAAAIALTAATLVVGPGRGAPDLSPCGIRYPSDASVEWECHPILGRETLERLFGERWSDVARFNRIDRRHVSVGLRIKVPKRLALIECFTPVPQHYAPAEPDSKFVLVDLSEQFVGAYEFGRLVFSAPISSGKSDNLTPQGDFRVTAFDRTHRSSLYFIEGTDTPYPMHYGLRFHTTREGVNYWIHGRDLPGIPASHGCIGLYDEAMQNQCYGRPRDPVLADARRLFEWVIGSTPDRGGLQALPDGPRVRVIGETPGANPSAPEPPGREIR